MKQAEAEGFMINGKLPTRCKCEKIMILHSNYTISYINSRLANAAYGAGENRNIYCHNYRNNILNKDRFGYDVFFHTDLSRTSGESNGQQLLFRLLLETIHPTGLLHLTREQLSIYILLQKQRALCQLLI